MAEDGNLYDEEQELEQQRKAKRQEKKENKGDGFKSEVKDKVKEKAKEKLEDKFKDKFAKEGTKQAGKEAGKQAAKEAGKQVAKEAGKQAATSAASSAAAAGGTAAGGAAAAAGGTAAAALGSNPVGWAILIAIVVIIVIIVILIIVTGLVGFFATMPGLMTGKLKEIAQNVADSFQNLYKTGADAQVNKENIIDTAEYIKSMGYDLIGYGFIPANNSISLGNKTRINEKGEYVDKDGNKVTDPGEYYDEYGLGYTTTGTETGVSNNFETAGKITDYLDEVDIKTLKTYALSDMRLYCIRNDDRGIGVLDAIHDYYIDNDSDWAGGLISLYHAKDFIADKKYSKLEAGSISINPKQKEMTIQVGWFTNQMKFGLDGWSGRYGLSLEFLLSLHLATMAPELATTMARTFDTEVQVYLDSVKDITVTGYYKDENTPDYITVEKMDGAIAAVDEGDSATMIGNEDALTIMEALSIKSIKEGEGHEDFVCKYGANNRVMYVNGLVSDKIDCFEDFSKESNGIYMQNLVTKEAKEGGATSWDDVVANSDYHAGSAVEAGADDDGDDLYHIVPCVNNLLSYMKTNYSDWVSTADSSKTVSSDASNYTISSISDLGSLVPFNGADGILSMAEDTYKEYQICSYRSNHSDLSEKVTIQFSIFVYKTSGDDNWDFAIVLYEIPSEKESSEETTCSDMIEHNRESISKVCTPCEKYVESIRNALNDINKDESFDTYIPYIARVVDSWFRDTYFVVPTDDAAEDDKAIKDVYEDKDNTKSTNYGDSEGEIKLSGDSIQYVEVDNEYLKETDEYWTKYETTEHPETGKTAYVLYEMDDEGNVIEGGPTYIPTVNEEGVEGYLKNGTTYISKEDLGDDIKLVKKAITSSISDGEEDYGENHVWNAYRTGAPKGKTEIAPVEVTADTESEDMKKVTLDPESGNYKDYLYYTMENLPTIDQKEDGRRGITNSTIKRMFKNRKYYIYDGTSERAEAIYKDWQKILDEYMVYAETNVESILVAAFLPSFSTIWHAVKENGTDARKSAVEELVIKAIDDYYYGYEGDEKTSTITLEKDPRNPDLIGNIAINKDTLNAFSILENTNTLDADYQYRDFKELIVELNYFDKEDLSDKSEEVFTWILPEYKEAWPIRKIDKSEQYYGTTIHFDGSVSKIKENFGISTSEEGEEGEPESVEGETEGESVEPVETPETNKDMTQLAAAKGYTVEPEPLDIVSPVTGKVLNYGTYTRKNTDYEQYEKDKEGYEEKEEEVGFIQIQILGLDRSSEEGPKEIFTDTNLTTSTTVEVDEGGNETLKDSDVWNSFYEEYRGVCEDYIITIDGIKLLDDSITSKDELIARVKADSEFLQAAEIDPASVPNLADDDEEKQRKTMEKAKVNTVPFVIIGEDLYIREGTIIGQTTETSTDTDYSYIRMIMRNADLEIQENIEKYFDLPEIMTLAGVAYSDSLPSDAIAWIELLEGKNNPAYINGDNFIAYEVKDPNGGTDGTVTAGPGVTNHLGAIFEELGYGDYHPMIAGNEYPQYVIMEVYYANIDKDSAAIQEQFEGITFSETEMAALIATKYQRGSIPSNLANEIRRYKRGEANNLESVWTYYGGTFPGVPKRRKAEYILFTTGEYTNPYD